MEKDPPPSFEETEPQSINDFIFRPYSQRELKYLEDLKKEMSLERFFIGWAFIGMPLTVGLLGYSLFLAFINTVIMKNNIQVIFDEEKDKPISKNKSKTSDPVFLMKENPKIKPFKQITFKRIKIVRRFGFLLSSFGAIQGYGYYRLVIYMRSQVYTKDSKEVN